jgi:hypothetical protein
VAGGNRAHTGFRCAVGAEEMLDLLSI